MIKTKKRKCQHVKLLTMTYTQHMMYEDARMKRGDVKKKCPACKLFVWKTYFTDFKKKNK